LCTTGVSAQRHRFSFNQQDHTTRAELRYKGIFLWGNPAYYAKFGFVNAKAFNVTTSDGSNYDSFMELELEKNRFTGITGKFVEDKVFIIDEHELKEFEKQFPPREKHVTDTQLKL
jgi:hypothetical protein